MLSKFIFAALLVCVVGFAQAEDSEKSSYEGFKLLKVFTKTQEQADIIAELQHNEDVYNIERYLHI
jgi:hypothetical protein